MLEELVRMYTAEQDRQEGLVETPMTDEEVKAVIRYAVLEIYGSEKKMEESLKTYFRME